MATDPFASAASTRPLTWLQKTKKTVMNVLFHEALALTVTFTQRGTL